MRSTPWHRSLSSLLLASVLLPPSGLILLWTRQGAGILRKIFGSLAIAALGVAYLFLFFGLRVEMDGSGIFPVFSFYKPESHYAALARSRTEQPPAPPPAEAARAEAPPPVSPTQPSRSLPAAYWTDFRGPNRDGRYDEMKILADWPSRGLPRLWKQPIGGGYASFVIAGGRAFTIEQRRQQEVVAAYDVETGRELWTHGWDAEFREAMGGDGPRATPTWDDGRLYALGATGEFRCLEAATGKALWGLNILSDNQAENLTWGMAASPLIVDEKVIVLPGGSPGKSVVAYHKFTGGLSDRCGEAESIFQSLTDRYERLYYTGLVHERWAKAQLGAGRPPHTVLALFEKALRCFEEAEKIRPEGNDDAILRWNRCVRLLQSRLGSEWQREEVEAFDASDSPPI